MPNVSFKRKELRDLLSSYALVETAIAGELAVKAKGQLYLPHPQPSLLGIDPEAWRQRYAAYKTRATFFGVTGRTMRGMVGQVFNREPEITIPGVLTPMLTDVNGLGTSIKQQMKQSVGRVVAKGRGGLLTDYPTVENGASAEDIATGFIKPTITPYAPEQIINWRTGKDGTKEVVTLIVLEEIYQDNRDAFEVQDRKRWRVLYLENGEYYQQIWKDNSGAVSTVKPLDFAGNAFKSIPFDFIGSEDNDPSPDPVTMYDIASLNMAHYRNSADFEDMLFMLGQATPVFSGLSQQWVKEVLGGRIELGSRGSISLPTGAKAELLQMSADIALATEMEAKERRMVALGAKLVEQRTVQRTATEATQAESAESSQLSTIADNVAAAYLNALSTARRFVSDDGSVLKVALNTQFDLTQLDAPTRLQTIKEWQAEAITFGEMRAVLKRGGIATLDDVTALAKIQEESNLLAAGRDQNPTTLNDPVPA